MKYKILQWETWVRECEVEADSEDQALEKMDDGETQKERFEYSDTIKIDVEEIKSEPEVSTKGLDMSGADVTRLAAQATQRDTL